MLGAKFVRGLVCQGPRCPGIAKLCQGGKGRYVGRGVGGGGAFQWIIVLGKKCEPVVVFESLDLSVC